MGYFFCDLFATEVANNILHALLLECGRPVIAPKIVYYNNQYRFIGHCRNLKIFFLCSSGLWGMSRRLSEGLFQGIVGKEGFWVVNEDCILKPTGLLEG